MTLYFARDMTYCANDFLVSRGLMIHLENISKQNGRQILFIEASAALQKGEKVGLVGPNGAGQDDACFA